MTGWKVELLPIAAQELAALATDLQARFLRVAELLQSFGPDRVREPHVKHLEGKLWEMRLTGRDGIARAIYFVATRRRLIIVKVFQKKTQKAPRRELMLARQRMERFDDV